MSLISCQKYTLTPARAYFDANPDADIAHGLYQGELPAGDDQPAAAISIREFELPSDVFQSDYSTAELTPGVQFIVDAIYSGSAFAGGDAIWMKSDEAPSPNFLMQFNETFANIKLGDNGIMYLYKETAFWQCP